MRWFPFLIGACLFLGCRSLAGDTDLDIGGYELVVAGDSVSYVSHRFYPCIDDVNEGERIVSVLRSQFKKQLALLDEALLPPSYRTPTEIFLAPSLEADPEFISQGAESDSAYVCRMLEVFAESSQEGLGDYFYDGCGNPRPSLETMVQGGTTVKFIRIDLASTGDFRLWDSRDQSILEIRPRDCEYEVRLWVFAIILVAFEEQLPPLTPISI